jgi:Protein of unknown function (DUF4446)
VTLTSAQLTGLTAVLGVVALVAVALAIGSHLRLSRMRRRFSVLWAGGETDVATLASDQERRLTSLADQVEAVREDIRGVRKDMRQSLRNVAVVRYDAFGDMGGRLSFSCAVVDDEGDGLVISSIHARGESRTYAKGIVGGSSEITLTPEEQQALRAARSGPEAAAARTPGRVREGR